jgi:hypothetical protein
MKRASARRGGRIQLKQTTPPNTQTNKKPGEVHEQNIVKLLFKKAKRKDIKPTQDKQVGENSTGRPHSKQAN